jgi:peptide chain release factor 1
VLDKLAAIKRRWEEVEQKLSDPKVIGDMKEFKKFNKEYKDLNRMWLMLIMITKM